MINYPGVVEKVRLSIALIFVLDVHGEVIRVGSGFVFIKKGNLVTCNHVVAGARDCLINFFDPTQTLQGRVVLNDTEHDLAQIKFNDDSREPLLMGEMEKVVEGMSVIFSSYRFNLKYLTTRLGILSSITKDVTGITTYSIDGSVQGGDSGCPLIDSSGGVIGIVNAKRVIREDILKKMREAKTGPVSFHEIDLVKIYQVFMGHLHLGVGYAIPASYISLTRAKLRYTSRNANDQKGEREICRALGKDRTFVRKLSHKSRSRTSPRPN